MGFEGSRVGQQLPHQPGGLREPVLNPHLHLFKRHRVIVSVYAAGPLLGGALAVGVFALLRDRHVLTAKLFHDPTYPSVTGGTMPTRP